MQSKLFSNVLYCSVYFIISCGRVFCMDMAGQWESFWRQDDGVKKIAASYYSYIDNKQKRLDSIAKEIKRKDIFDGKNFFCDESCRYILISGHVPTIDIDIVQEGCYELMDILIGSDACFVRNFLRNTPALLRSYISNVASAVSNDILDTILRTREKYALSSFKNDFSILTEDLFSYAVSLYDVICALFKNDNNEEFFSCEVIRVLAQYRKNIFNFFRDSNKAKDLLLKYLDALNTSYLQFFQAKKFSSVDKVLLNKAVLQINTILSLSKMDSRRSLNVTLNIITLFQNELFNECVRPFTHTEHMWVYLLFLKDRNDVTDKIIPKVISSVGESKIIIGTKMDMCNKCESLICNVAEELKKELLVISITEHIPSASYSRSGNFKCVKKVPLDSEISRKNSKSRAQKHIKDLSYCCQKNISEDPEIAERIISLQTVFSVRMLALLGLSENIMNPGIIKTAGEFAKVPSINLVPDIFNSSNIIMDLVSLHCCFFYTVFVDKKIDRLTNIKMNFLFQKNKIGLDAFNHYLEICKGNDTGLKQKVELEIAKAQQTEKKEKARQSWLKIIKKVKEAQIKDKLKNYQQMLKTFSLWKLSLSNNPIQ